MMQLFSRNGHNSKDMFLLMKAERLAERQAGRKEESMHKKQTNKQKIARQSIRKHAGKRTQNTGKEKANMQAENRQQIDNKQTKKPAEKTTKKQARCTAEAIFHCPTMNSHRPKS
jgi:hypothetical protein